MRKKIGRREKEMGEKVSEKERKREGERE